MSKTELHTLIISRKMVDEKLLVFLHCNSKTRGQKGEVF